MIISKEAMWGLECAVCGLAKSFNPNDPVESSNKINERVCAILALQTLVLIDISRTLAELNAAGRTPEHK